MGRIALTDTDRLRAYVQKPYTTTFWGGEYEVKPALVSESLGKGDALLGIHPIMHRPQYYVIRIDRRWFEGDGIWDHLDEIYNAIECEYPAYDEDEDGNELEVREWPNVGMGDGSSWWRYYLYGRPRRRFKAGALPSSPSEAQK